MVDGLDVHVNDLAALLDEQRIPYCYQCSRCTSACPVALVTSSFNPRSIILRVLLNDKESPVDDEDIWKCVSCHSCEEACPKGVKVAGIITLLRNEAFRKGKAPKAYTNNISLFLRSGMVASISGAERARNQVGLGALRTPDVDEIIKLLDGTSLRPKKGGGVG